MNAPQNQQQQQQLKPKENEPEKEFYDIFFYTKLIYNRPLNAMFNKRDLENDLNGTLNQPPRPTNEVKQPFIRLMKLMKPRFSEVENNDYDMLKDLHTKENINLFKLCECVMTTLKTENDYLIDLIVVMYFFYCAQHSIVPIIARAQLDSACDSIRSIHPKFPKRKYLAIIDRVFEQREIIANVRERHLSELIKEILLMHLRSGHISFVVALLLRVSRIPDKMKLQRVLLYVFEMLGDEITDYQRYILQSMYTVIAKHKRGEEEITIALKSCFFPNMIVYFLFDFPENMDFKSRVKSFIEFINGEFDQFFVNRAFEHQQNIENPPNNDNDFVAELEDDDAVAGVGLPLLPLGAAGPSRRRRRQQRQAPAAQPRRKKPRNNPDNELTDMASELTSEMKDIISAYIGFCFQKAGLTYAYDKQSYIDVGNIQLVDRIFEKRQLIQEPSRYAYWYRRESGIYNSLTRAYERHSPALFGVTTLHTPIWVPQNYNHNPFDYEMKNKVFDTALKAIHFLKVCRYNRLMCTVLGRLEGSTDDYIYPVRSLKNLYSDLYSNQDFLPDEYYILINVQYPELNNVFLWLYMIVCELSKTIPDIQYLISRPEIFISQMFMAIENEIYGEKKPPETETPQDTTFHNTNADSDMQELDEEWRIQLEQTRFHNTFPITLSNEEENGDLTCLQVSYLVSKNNNYNVQIFEQVFKRKPDPEIIKNTRNIWNDIEINGGKTLKQFLLVIVSWFLRMDIHHTYASTEFFKNIIPKKRVLFEDLTHSLLSTCGPILENDGKKLAVALKIFCQNTKLCLDDEFVKKSTPVGYQINYSPQTPFDMDIYLAVTDLIFQSQFNEDVFVDFLKMFARIQHPGNTTSRVCTAFMQKTATGKSDFMQMLCGQLSTAHVSVQMFSGSELSKRKYGSTLAVAMNRNLLTAFEELTNFDNKFKLVCSNGELSFRKPRTNQFLALRTNSHMMCSTNFNPTIISDDPSVLARLNFFERRYSFVQFNKNFVIHREKDKPCIDLPLISDELGVQMIVEHLPQGQPECNFGYYLLIFLLSDVFLKDFFTPVSLRISATSEKIKSKFICNAQPASATSKKIKSQFFYNVQPVRYILDNNLTLNYQNPMPMAKFDAQATCLFKSIKSTRSISTVVNAKLADALAELKLLLTKYIDTKKNVIYVNFK